MTALAATDNARSETAARNSSIRIDDLCLCITVVSPVHAKPRSLNAPGCVEPRKRGSSTHVEQGQHREKEAHFLDKRRRLSQLSAASSSASTHLVRQR